MYFNYKVVLGLLLLLFFILLFYFFFIKSSKLGEGFSLYNNNNNTFVPWSKDLVHRFKVYQATVGENNYQYNMFILQQQATAADAEHLLSTGYWPWSDDIKQKYMDAVSMSPIISIDPGEAANNAMKIYNENAIKEQLAFNTKEGKFLIYGTFLEKDDNNSSSSNDAQEYGVFNGNKLNPTTIRCSDDLHSSVLQKKVFNGYNLWNGYKNTTTKTIKNEDIPSEVAGFSFVNGPCNPCSYTCPFRIVVGDKTGDKISPVWADLWKLN